jgi:deoxyribodipyrimidine photo-lyase
MNSTPEAPAIVWFRRDLRLEDNPALVCAAASGRPVIPVFVLEQAASVRPLGGASRWWLDKSLRALAAGLERRGLRLVLLRGEAGAVVQRLAEETGAAAVYWNRLYEAPEIARDTALKSDLRSQGLEVESFNASLLNEPWAVSAGSGGGYQVFTAYWRAAQQRIGDRVAAKTPDAFRPPARWPDSEELDGWRLHPRRPDWSAGFEVWTPGEAGARTALERFVDGALDGYGRTRDLPGVEGVSRLSPHLHWGELGPHQVWRAVQARAHADPRLAADADKFLAELGWREFNHHLAFHHPDLARTDFKPTFRGLAWRRDAEGFEAWSRGRTGYPIVDAGMRQLWATGWMHNRVRMIAASFLVKDLLVDWREGEAWFWDTLADADAANNAANWQWVAGCGADAAPFFRIFNPVLQGERFDPDGAYVRRWVPELRGMPGALIHKPWTAQPPPGDYPRPILDHGHARKRALAAYEAQRG